MTTCCAMNCCQHFPLEKTLLMKQKLWSLSFEDHKTYVLDIPRRLHTKGDERQWKFINIQGLDIYKIVWYQIIGLSKSRYMLYKSSCWFLPHVATKLHINYIYQPGKRSQLFNHWLICLQIQCRIKSKGLEMVDQMCDVFCLKHGRVCKSKVIK